MSNGSTDQIIQIGEQHEEDNLEFIYYLYPEFRLRKVQVNWSDETKINGV